MLLLDLILSTEDIFISNERKTNFRLVTFQDSYMGKKTEIRYNAI